MSTTGQAGAAGTFDMGTAERLMADLRTETARADIKGSVLVGAQGMAAAGLVAALTTRSRQPDALGVAGQVLWWAGAISFLASLIAMVLAVVPRYRSRWQPGMPLTYFADIRRAADHGPGALEGALHDTDHAAREAVLAALGENSRIVVEKYRWLWVGTACFVASLILLPSALVAA